MNVGVQSVLADFFPFFLLFIYLFGCARSYLWRGESFKSQHVGSSFSARDQTWAPAMGVQSLSHWVTREIPDFFLFWKQNIEILGRTSNMYSPTQGIFFHSALIKKGLIVVLSGT